MESSTDSSGFLEMTESRGTILLLSNVSEFNFDFNNPEGKTTPDFIKSISNNISELTINGFINEPKKISNDAVATQTNTPDFFSENYSQAVSILEPLDQKNDPTISTSSDKDIITTTKAFPETEETTLMQLGNPKVNFYDNPDNESHSTTTSFASKNSTTQIFFKSHKDGIQDSTLEGSIQSSYDKIFLEGKFENSTHAQLETKINIPSKENVDNNTKASTIINHLTNKIQHAEMETSSKPTMHHTENNNFSSQPTITSIPETRILNNQLDARSSNLTTAQEQVSNNFLDPNSTKSSFDNMTKVNNRSGPASGNSTTSKLKQIDESNCSRVRITTEVILASIAILYSLTI